MAQDIPRCLKSAPKMLADAPRTLHDGSKRPPKPPASQNPYETGGKMMYVVFSPFCFRWPSEASKWFQDGSRGP
eukprot:7928408-Pyramimonas_sp.AAC.1